MLVEDDNNLREIYAARLAADGHEIVAAKDGEEALAMAVKEKPDLIIADIMMPRISGFDMLDILRNAPETKDTKVIMMTALSQAEDKARADQLGADRYLVKSQVTLEDVVQSVRDVLHGNQSAIVDSDGTHLPSAPPLPRGTSTTPIPPTGSDDNTTSSDDDDTDTTDPSSIPPSDQPKPDGSSTPPVSSPGAPDDTTNDDTDDPAPPAFQPQPKSNLSGSNTKRIDVVNNQPVSRPPTLVIPTQTDNNSPKPATPPLSDPSLPIRNTNGNQPIVGPTLAQALAEEEAAVKEKINKFVDSLDAPKASSNADLSEEVTAEGEAALVDNGPQKTTGKAAEPMRSDLPTLEEEPDETQAAMTPQTDGAITADSDNIDEPSGAATPPPSSVEVAPASTAESDELVTAPIVIKTKPVGSKRGGQHKKVIEPLNDPRKGPDLQALLAKEESRNPSPPLTANTVVAPRKGQPTDPVDIDHSSIAI